MKTYKWIKGWMTDKEQLRVMTSILNEMRAEGEADDRIKGLLSKDEAKHLFGGRGPHDWMIGTGCTVLKGGSHNRCEVVTRPGSRVKFRAVLCGCDSMFSRADCGEYAYVVVKDVGYVVEYCARIDEYMHRETILYI